MRVQMQWSKNHLDNLLLLHTASFPEQCNNLLRFPALARQPLLLPPGVAPAAHQPFRPQADGRDASPLPILTFCWTREFATIKDYRVPTQGQCCRWEKVKDHILTHNCPLKARLTTSHATILSEIKLCRCQGQNRVIFAFWYEVTCSSLYQSLVLQ